mmetsp:Transcript_44291/g.141809  ORF Transcript_44291/g.141809 Transcript_44291/m.141809 type:complete len:101 (+) Transcript_44291:76-378(+)
MAPLLPAPLTCSIGQKQSLLQSRRSHFTQSSIMVQSVLDPEDSLKTYIRMQNELLNSDGPEPKSSGAPEPKCSKDYAKMMCFEQPPGIDLDGSRNSLGGC